MQHKLKRSLVWTLTVLILTMALLLLGVDSPYFIGFAVMFLPFLLLLQVWYILRDPGPDKDDEPKEGGYRP